MGNSTSEAFRPEYPYHTLCPLEMKRHPSIKVAADPSNNILNVQHVAGVVGAAGVDTPATATSCAKVAVLDFLPLTEPGNYTIPGQLGVPKQCNMSLLLEYLQLQRYGLPVTAHHKVLAPCRGVLRGLRNLLHSGNVHATAGSCLAHPWFEQFALRHVCYIQSQKQQQQVVDVPDAAMCLRAAWHVARYILPGYADRVRHNALGTALADVDPAIPALRLKGGHGRRWCVLDNLQQVHLPQAVAWVNKNLGEMPLFG